MLRAHVVIVKQILCIKLDKYWDKWSQNSIGLHVQYSLFVSDFNKYWIFSTVSIGTQISNFIEIRPVGAKLFHTGGQTDMTKLIVVFYNFAKAPKNHMDEAYKFITFSGEGTRT